MHIAFICPDLHGHLNPPTVLLPRHATESRIRGAVQRLLHQPQYGTAAQTRHSELQRLNGPAMASDIIERAFFSNKLSCKAVGRIKVDCVLIPIGLERIGVVR